MGPKSSGGCAPRDAAANREILDELCRSGEHFHGSADQGLANWQLGAEALSLILDRVAAGDRTLETGCGYSTVVFALAGANHTVVSPMSLEHERIRAWCAAHGVSTETLTFLVEHSQNAVPRLGSDPLDFVLVDGAHAFPLPFVDWYYAAVRLRVGGLMMIDDTHIRTGEILRDFLQAESTRWRPVAELPTTAVFEKLADDIVPNEDWCGQPYCARPRRLPGAPLWPRVRQFVRLRSRLRAAAARLRRSLPGDRGV